LHHNQKDSNCDLFPVRLPGSIEFPFQKRLSPYVVTVVKKKDGTCITDRRDMTRKRHRMCSEELRWLRRQHLCSLLRFFFDNMNGSLASSSSFSRKTLFITQKKNVKMWGNEAEGKER
jgi:hypothetical protein